MAERQRGVIPGFDALKWSRQARRDVSTLIRKMAAEERRQYFQHGTAPDRLKAWYDERFDDAEAS